MEKIKKERRFLKTLGKVGEILIQEVLIKVGSSLIKRIGGKKNMPSILFLFLSINLFAQYPNTGNKQRLGFQTTADGLVWRGSISDTASIQPVSNQNAWVILDTVNLKIYSFDFTSNVWNQVGGGAAFTQPIDSLFFKKSVPPNNVDTAKMRWDSELGTVVLGMYDKVPNELGFKNFWLVKNQTGSTITKNSLVYASGTVGASGRISVSKFIANGTIDAKYLLGITAHDLENGEDGYVISFGKIRQVNTDTFAAGAILYPSPTTAGVWTDVEPVAPNLDLPIGFCINSSSNNGTIAIRYASGYKLNELHDLAISSPVDKASLYYSGGLWRDTTAALLVSDTASMLTNYLRTGVAASTYLPLTGGTLTGALNGTTGTFTTRLGVGSSASINPTIFSSGTGDQEIHFTHSDNVDGRKINLRLTNNNNSFYSYGGLIYAIQGEGINQYNRMTLGINTTEILHLTRFSRVGIMNNSPSYTLDVNGTFNASGNSLIGGTLGVTGSATFNNTSRFVGNVAINTTTAYKPLEVYSNANDFVSVGVRTLAPYQYTGINFGYVEANTLFRKSAIVFQRNDTQLGAGDASGKVHILNMNVGNAGASATLADAKLTISNTGNVGINDTTPDYQLKVNGTLNVTSTTTLTGALTVNNATVLNEGSGDFDTRIESDGNANMVFVDASTDRVGIGTNTPSKTLDVNGEVKIATVTATPTALLGKDASNVVGEVTTVAQTGLMTRGATTATTGTPSAVFTVTHGLGSNPTSVIVTGTGAIGAQKLIFEVYAKNSTTFSIQVWNYDGTEAASTSVTIYWLAIK